MTDESLLQAAIDAARRGIAAGQTPFGAVIARDGEAIAAAHNRVWADTDITAHAEVTAVREACKALGTVDLSGCTVYSTTEPCPMCFSAIHWARISRIVYGAVIADAQRFGFNELDISNETLAEIGGRDVDIRGGLLREECVALFEEWANRSDKKTY